MLHILSLLNTLPVTHEKRLQNTVHVACVAEVEQPRLACLRFLRHTDMRGEVSVTGRVPTGFRQLHFDCAR